MGIILFMLLVISGISPSISKADSFSDMDKEFASDGFFKDSPTKGVFKDDAWFSDNPSQKAMEADFFNDYSKGQTGKNKPGQPANKKKQPAPGKPVSKTEASAAPAQAAPKQQEAANDFTVELGACLLFPNDSGRMRCNLKITNSGKDRVFEFSSAESSITDSTAVTHTACESSLKNITIKAGSSYYTYIQKKNVSPKASELKKMKVVIKADGKMIDQEFKGVKLVKK